MGPSSILDAVLHLVVLDGSQALLEEFGIQQGVEGVPTRTEAIELGRHQARVLLLRQVLYWRVRNVKKATYRRIELRQTSGTRLRSHSSQQ